MLSPLPSHYRYALVFDVETTGLLPKIDPVTKLYPPLDQYPHVIQMSWLQYDLVRNCVAERSNSYIKVPEGVVISEFITGLTGITHEMCATQGEPIQDVIARFHEVYKRSQVVVAHNVFFDKKMVSIIIDSLDENYDSLFPNASTTDFNIVRLRIRGYSKGEPIVFHGTEILTIQDKGLDKN